MTTNRTGPELFGSALAHRRDAVDMYDPGTAEQREQLDIGLLEAVNANTAMLRTIAGILATAMGVRDADLEGWDEVIPTTPQRACWSRTDRRPECAERHTEDCDYADPVPEPKHELLPVGTRVLVSEPVWDESEQRIVWHNPQAGRISGYDMHRSKYRWQVEFEPGRYSSTDQWAFVDNRVIVHPDGPECPPGPEPVKQEPTGPRVYVQHEYGKQGHLASTPQRNGQGALKVQVHWYAPGTQPVWVLVDRLTVIAAEDVDRCPNGQTRDECGSGENQCDSCLADEDDEADTIERSMGLR